MFEDRKFIITDRYEALDKRAAEIIFSEIEEFATTGIDGISRAYWDNRQGSEKAAHEAMDKVAGAKDRAEIRIIRDEALKKDEVWRKLFIA